MRPVYIQQQEEIDLNLFSEIMRSNLQKTWLATASLALYGISVRSILYRFKHAQGHHKISVELVTFSLSCMYLISCKMCNTICINYNMFILDTILSNTRGSQKISFESGAICGRLNNMLEPNCKSYQLG